jgi:hypothetical protein
MEIVEALGAPPRRRREAAGRDRRSSPAGAVGELGADRCAGPAGLAALHRRGVGPPRSCNPAGRCPQADRDRLGLLGLVRGDDPVPDYRLKMGATVAPLGKLSTWWREAISAELARTARRRFVVDLLPQEHRGALDTRRLDGISITLVDPSGKPGGHFAKAAKGELARAILTDGLGALDTWRTPASNCPSRRSDPHPTEIRSGCCAERNAHAEFRSGEGPRGVVPGRARCRGRCRAVSGGTCPGTPPARRGR